MREVECNRLVFTIVALTANLHLVPRFDRAQAASHSQGGFPSQVGFLPPGAWHLHDGPDDHAQDLDVLGLGLARHSFPDPDDTVFRIA